MGKKGATKETATAVTTVTEKGRDKVERPRKAESEEVPMEPMTGGPVPMAEVSFAAGATLNMGNWESARVDVSIRLPCPADPGKIDHFFGWAKAWVQARLAEEMSELEEAR